MSFYNGQSINTSGEVIYGNGNNIKGDRNTIIGNGNNIKGDSCIVTGNGNNIKGNNCAVTGNGNNVQGEKNTVNGINNTINSIDNVKTTNTFYNVDSTNTGQINIGGSLKIGNISINSVNFNNENYDYIFVIQDGKIIGIKDGKIMRNGIMIHELYNPLDEKFITSTSSMNMIGESSKMMCEVKTTKTTYKFEVNHANGKTQFIFDE